MQRLVNVLYRVPQMTNNNNVECRVQQVTISPDAQIWMRVVSCVNSCISDVVIPLQFIVRTEIFFKTCWSWFRRTTTVGRVHEGGIAGGEGTQMVPRNGLGGGVQRTGSSISRTWPANKVGFTFIHNSAEILTAQPLTTREDDETLVWRTCTGYDIYLPAHLFITFILNGDGDSSMYLQPVSR